MNSWSRIKSQGQALIEFTLMVPIILIILAGLTDLGLAFFIGMATQNAVREGARIAATTDALPVNDGTVQSEVLGRIPAIDQFTVTSVTNTGPGTPANCAENVTVTATGTYNFAFLRFVGFTTMTISRSATMRYEDRPLCT